MGPQQPGIDAPLAFDARGLLAPGDYPMTLAGLRRSLLAAGPPGRATWDRAWRATLLDNLEFLARQLWAVGIRNIYIGGSFASDKDRPGDLDGYFECDRAAYKTRALHDALNELDPFRAWTWRAADLRAAPDGRAKIPLWHHYRVELFPYYGQPATGFFDREGNDVNYPAFLRRHPTTFEPQGVIRLVPLITSAGHPRPPGPAPRGYA